MTPEEVREDHIRMLQQEVACMKGGASLSCEVYAEALDRCQRKNKVDWYADIDALLDERRSILDALEELVNRCDGEEGVRADGSNIQTMRATAVLAKHGR